MGRTRSSHAVSRTIRLAHGVCSLKPELENFLRRQLHRVQGKIGAFLNMDLSRYLAGATIAENYANGGYKRKASGGAVAIRVPQCSQVGV